MATNVERIEALEARVTAIEEAPVEVEGLQEVADAIEALEGQIDALAAQPIGAGNDDVPMRSRKDPEKFQEGQVAARERARAARKERFGG